MKIKSTLLKMALFGFFMAFALNSSAQATATYSLYVCQGGTATLTGPTLASGQTLQWTENKSGTHDIVKTSTGTDNQLAIPTTLTPGEHIFNVAIISGDLTTTGCLGDLSADFKVFVLPTIDFALATATNNGTYCESNGGLTTADPLKTSSLTATVTAPTGITLPIEVTYEFSWSVTKDAVAATNATVGTITDATSSTTFAVKTATHGTYAFTPTVVYKVPSTASINVKNTTTGCSLSATAKSVIVTEKPGAPTISF